MPSKLVAFRIEEKQNESFRTRCKNEGRSMNAVVNRLIEMWLAGGVSLDKPKKKI
jgi:hypothetical protein